MGTRIQASDEIVVSLSPTAVWRLLADIAATPGWWPANPRLRVLKVAPGIVGSELEIRPLGGRAFCCRVVSVEEPRRLRMEYFGGFITGRGEWILEAAGGGTRIRYELDVQAAGRLVAWLGRLFPLGRLHSGQMKGVLEGLRRALEA